MQLMTKNYQLTTAEILYLLPDYPSVLQSFIWQKIDCAPDYPRLHQFLDYWKSHIDGPIHSVRVAGRDLVAPARVRGVKASFVLH